MNYAHPLLLRCAFLTLHLSNLLEASAPSRGRLICICRVNDYITRNRHYQQVWDIVNLYDDVLCQGRATELPTLAIWGTEDKIYDIRGADRLQRCIPGSQVIRLPKAGHLLLMENSEEATADYLRFVNVFHSKSTLPMS